MNAAETANVLAVMHVAWPAVEFKPQTPDVWAEMLIGADARDGMTAAKSLMRSSKWFPSISEFIAAAQSACRVRTGDAEGRTPGNTRAVAELEPAESFTRAQQDENIRRLQAEMRQMLARQKGYEHKHGKLGPCPVPGCPSTRKAEVHEDF